MQRQGMLHVQAIMGEFERTVRYPMRENKEVLYHIRTFRGTWMEHRGSKRVQAIIYTRKPVDVPIPWAIYDISLWNQDKWESMGTQLLSPRHVHQVLQDCFSLIPNRLVGTL